MQHANTLFITQQKSDIEIQTTEYIIADYGRHIGGIYVETQRIKETQTEARAYFIKRNVLDFLPAKGVWSVATPFILTPN